MSGDRRFPPSTKKLRRARESGDYVRSRHLSGFVAAAIGALILLRISSHLIQPPRGLITFTSRLEDNCYEQAWSIVRIWLPLIVEALSGVAALWLGIVIVELTQSRGYIHRSLVRFDLLALSPLRGLKRMFSIDDEISISALVLGWFSVLFVALFKILVVASILTLLVQSWFSLQGDPGAAALKLRLTVLLLTGVALGVTGVTALVDLLWSTRKRNQRLMMDYNEMIQDLRENEGNQEVKMMRRRAHQEILREADVNRVRSAKILLTD